MPIRYTSSIVVNFTESNFQPMFGDFFLSLYSEELNIAGIDYSSITVESYNFYSDLTINNQSVSFYQLNHKFSVAGTTSETGSGSCVINFSYYYQEGAEPEISRRLLKGDQVVYPFTRQENVIGLQKTIKEKLPIISESQPSTGYVPRQAWIQPGEVFEESIPVISSFDSRGVVEENYDNSEIVIEENYSDSVSLPSGQENDIEENYGSSNSIIEENYGNGL